MPDSAQRAGIRVGGCTLVCPAALASPSTPRTGLTADNSITSTCQTPSDVDDVRNILAELKNKQEREILELEADKSRQVS